MYSISLEQYNKLLTLINNQGLSDIANIVYDAKPILYFNPEIDDKNIGVINKNGKILYYINECKTLVSNNKQALSFSKLNAKSDEIEYVFTTETLEDIILSFSQSKPINLNDIQGPILKR